MRILSWVKSLFSPGRGGVHPARHAELAGRYASLKAKYEASVTNDDNRKHWRNADGLSAAAANSPGVRRTLRNRSRFEYDNSGYYAGMIRTRADDLVGVGPTLQIVHPDESVAGAVEQAFSDWAEASCFAEALHTLDQAECRDGEAFALLATNPNVPDPVKLKVEPVEADRVCDPLFGELARDLPGGGAYHDGVTYDGYGNPVSYVVLRHHPGDHFSGARPLFDVVPARYVLHSFRRDRPGQLRGVPELTAGLPLNAYLRRFCLATLSAAEVAASFAVLLKSNLPPADEPEVLDPFSAVEIDRGMMAALPQGYDPTQLEAQHPNTRYREFRRETLGEIARPIGQPVNVATADSSQHNFSSAKLDHYGYRNGIKVRRNFRRRNLLERAYLEWSKEAVLVPGLLPAGVDPAMLRRVWFWPGWASMDKNEAKSDTEQLNNGTTTLSELLGEHGQRWQDFVDQRGRELARMQEKGVPPPAAGGGAGDGGGGAFGGSAPANGAEGPGASRPHQDGGNGHAAFFRGRHDRVGVGVGAAFCPTGPGGGVDPSCPPGGASGGKGGPGDRAPRASGRLPHGPLAGELDRAPHDAARLAVLDRPATVQALADVQLVTGFRADEWAHGYVSALDVPDAPAKADAYRKRLGSMMRSMMTVRPERAKKEAAARLREGGWEPPGGARASAAPGLAAAFCPTGPGGGVDPSCPPGGGGTGKDDKGARGPMTGRLPDGREVRFVPHPNQRRDETTVMVDAAKLDRAWSKDAGYYVPPGAPGIPGRREGVERFLARGEPVQASRLTLDPDGTASFIDGRHRFAVLRDKGIDRVAVTVPRSQAARVREALG